MDLSSLREELKQEQQFTSNTKDANDDLLSTIQLTLQEIKDEAQKKTKQLAVQQAQTKMKENDAKVRIEQLETDAKKRREQMK